MTINKHMALQVPARLSNENIEAISNYLPYRADMRNSWSVIEAPRKKEYVIFDVSVPQKKLIQPFTAAEAIKHAEKGILDGLTLGRTYIESHVTKYFRRSTTSRKWKRIHVFKPEKRSEKSNTRRENEKLDTIQCFETRTVSDCFRVIFSPKRIIDQANLQDSSLPCK